MSLTAHSITAQILAALSAPITQDTRLLKLHTVLGPDVLLAERVEIDEAIGPGPGPGPGTDEAATGLRLTVYALSTDTHLEFKRLIGQPALIELLTQASRTRLRPWHGHITRIELLGSDGGLARYRLTLEPWLAFLGHRQDSWVFQNQNVQGIVEEVFADYQAQGRLAPAWRWELADVSVYPQRSLCIQYQETDLQFIQRLLREEGLFHWFEHSGDPDASAFGSHTLVIADHNGAFTPDSQPLVPLVPLVRYTQSHMALGEDSITRWRRAAHIRSASLSLASPDHRAFSLRPVSERGIASPGASLLDNLTQSDIPGAYAYEDSAQGERLALRQMQAIDAVREQAGATSSVRTTAPGRSFTLTDHPVHDGSDAERDCYVTLRAQHRARNNLSADHKAHLQSLLGAIAADQSDTRPERGSNPTDEPLYSCELRAQRAGVPVRITAVDECGQPDPRIHPRPTMHGVQTALVVGGSDPIHTDRDHRIKVQFHWQRGARSSHRLDHPAGSNAPASDASGTWVRVSETVAGANWGMNFIPRLGQEVVIAFVEGDIDRPVVVGVAYNGRGQADAQGNQVAAGAALASGNAPAWFPGSQAQGRLQGHQHAAVHAGFKSQELNTSQSGTGGHNQLVFDDSPQAGRIELSSTSAQTRLQLGHLLNQNDNQRMQARGHGIDLTTAAWGAVRAGSGLLLSAHGRPGSQSASQQLDSTEPLSHLDQAQSLLHTLAESSQKQKAGLQGEPNVIGVEPQGKPDPSRQLPVEQALQGSRGSVGARGTADRANQSVPAWGRPDLVISAPAGIATMTPAGTVYSAGNTLALVGQQDIYLLAQANHAVASAYGIVLYTYGKGGNPKKPNQESGIKLHAASGSVNLQSQTGQTRLTADKAIEVSSTNDKVLITAPKRILMTAGGAAIDLQAGGITLKGPGKIEFRAGMKVFTGPASATAIAPSLPRSGPLPTNALEVVHRYHDDDSVQGASVEARLADGSVRRSATNSAGITVLNDMPPGAAQIRFKPDARPYAIKAMDDSPDYKPGLTDSDWEALAARNGGTP